MSVLYERKRVYCNHYLPYSTHTMGRGFAFFVGCWSLCRMLLNLGATSTKSVSKHTKRVLITQQQKQAINDKLFYGKDMMQRSLDDRAGY